MRGGTDQIEQHLSKFHKGATKVDVPGLFDFDIVQLDHNNFQDFMSLMSHLNMLKDAVIFISVDFEFDKSSSQISMAQFQINFIKDGQLFIPKRDIVFVIDYSISENSQNAKSDIPFTESIMFPFFETYLFSGQNHIFKLIHGPFSTDLPKLKMMVLNRNPELGRRFFKNIIDTKQLTDMFVKLVPAKRYPSGGDISQFYLKTETINQQQYDYIVKNEQMANQRKQEGKHMQQGNKEHLLYSCFDVLYMFKATIILVTKKYGDQKVFDFQQIAMFSDLICLYSIIKFFPPEVQSARGHIASYEVLKDKLQTIKLSEQVRQNILTKTQSNPIWKAMSQDDHQRPVLSYLLQLIVFLQDSQDPVASAVTNIVNQYDLQFIKTIQKELK